LWDAASGKEIRTFPGHQGTVESCAFSPSGVHLVSTADDRTLKLWEVKSGKVIKSIQLPWISQYVAISKDNRVITANENGTLTLFKFAELQQPLILTPIFNG
jgi:WD40 repeat protein